MSGSLAALLHISAIRTVMQAVVKGGLGVVDAAQGAAVVVSRQWDELATSVMSSAVAANERTRATLGQATADAPASDEVAPVEASVKRQRRPRTPAAGVQAVQAMPPTIDVSPSAPVVPSMALTRITGIGAGTAAVLAAAGVTTLQQLAAMDAAQLGEILAQASLPYRSMNPSSWPAQARQLLDSTR